MFSLSACQSTGNKPFRVELHYVPNPHLCCGNRAEAPTSKTLYRASVCCRVTSALSLLGGLLSIGLVENSGQSNEVKTGVCIAGGLLVLGSYYFFKLGSGYAFASETNNLDF